jgi:transposase
MRPKGTAEELERRRRRAVVLLNLGHGVRETARLVGASPGAVVAWRKAYEQHGDSGLRAKTYVGRTPGV